MLIIPDWCKYNGTHRSVAVVWIVPDLENVTCSNLTEQICSTNTNHFLPLKRNTDPVNVDVLV